ncbi:hypothetical protein [Ferruginibacter sp. HRS2-29]|uniref:hypothetical protein n=1 Tax=Ferruginibacter sp. HRS2-29 TaxID=2487334 RepID=UPI0020CD327D|nr:hypothetical protein [Ferruginibacter sp. HRS2-29]MCP9749785.1 hypothetical protein [Ferruginibacter sp. HRS2-29]
MSEKSTDLFSKEINEFIAHHNNIKKQYNQKGNETLKQSIEFSKQEKLLQPLHILDATIIFLVTDMIENDRLVNRRQKLKMLQMAAYLQGIDMASQLIFEGGYIKAAATLKQDYEMMVRLQEITDGKDKDGETPNPKNGSAGYRMMYGFFNDLAHPTKRKQMYIALKAVDGSSINISPHKKFNKDLTGVLMSFNCTIKLEILKQALNFHAEVYGNNKHHKLGISYYQLVSKHLIDSGFFAPEQSDPAKG